MTRRSFLGAAAAAAVMHYGRLSASGVDSSRLMNSNLGMVAVTVLLSLASYLTPILAVGAFGYGTGLIFTAYIPFWNVKKPLLDLTLE